MAGSRMVPEARRLALANNRARLAELYAEHRRYTGTPGQLPRRAGFPNHSQAIEAIGTLPTHICVSVHCGQCGDRPIGLESEGHWPTVGVSR
jgi:hypothetical protein